MSSKTLLTIKLQKTLTLIERIKFYMHTKNIGIILYSGWDTERNSLLWYSVSSMPNAVLLKIPGKVLSKIPL